MYLPIVIEWVTIMDLLNLNLMINHCIRKTILSGDCLLAHYHIPNYIDIIIIIVNNFTISRYTL